MIDPFSRQLLKTFRVSRVVRIFAASIALMALLMNTTACDSRAGESDAESDRNSLIVLSSLIAGQADFEAACRRSVAAGFACAENTGIGVSLARASYAGFLELSLGLAAAPTTASEGETCSDLYASPILTRATGATRVCYFNCEANFWNTALAANPTACNAIDYATLATRAPAEITGCFDACVRDTARFYY
ncbi:MAG: hypothetical protein NXI24_15610 [bacterium]|nr:hypothetical protein [bacterium]